LHQEEASFSSTSLDSPCAVGQRDSEPFTQTEDALLLSTTCTALLANNVGQEEETATALESLQRSNRVLLRRAGQIFDRAVALAMGVSADPPRS
jgi:hypothetical protein